MGIDNLSYNVNLKFYFFNVNFEDKKSCYFFVQKILKKVIHLSSALNMQLIILS